ncbi:hypothetical protein LPMP_201380 [Leishmania panamensis]|uniref:RNI-like protein n=1 Tax=Leishmania panamensis TaxID=5679 RepID=A0A088RNL9_LEIPA|nr:hypothetical protein LPMP_201380 [Leishmania panamensis]AIN97632.1 hypothetical protein LPMP_201380 [Leishmania panamensis]
MGCCCPGEEGLSNTRRTSESTDRQRGKRKAAEKTISSAKKAILGAAAAAGAPADEMRARVRRRALEALVESLHAGESRVPTMKWRRQYLKTPGIGSAVISVIANHIQGLPESVSDPITTAPQLLLNRPRHQIRTLDMRALRAGDDGFVEMMSALLGDTLIENVIFAGNEITDDGVRRLVSQIHRYTGMPGVEGGTSAAAAAAVAAGSVSQKSLPCKLSLLALTDNFITSDGIATFTTVAPLFLCLEQLEVGRGRSAGSGDMDDVRDTLSAQNISALSAYIQQTPKLVSFIYKGNGNYRTRNGFTPPGMAAFVDAVVGHSALKELSLQECFSTKPGMVGPVTMQAPGGEKATVTDEVDVPWTAESVQQPMQALATALNAPSSHLTTLTLRFPLSDEAIQTLSIGIAQAPHLLNLSLRGCDLSSKALAVIGDALCTNKALRLLDVSYQSNAIAHPALLAELRGSTKRRISLISTMGYTALDMTRQDVSSGNSEIPSREEVQHPLHPIIRSLHRNRSLSHLMMLGLNISTDDIEELCACIERSGNHTLTEVWYTHAGSEALDMKLEDFLASNRERGAGGAFGYSPLASTHGGMTSAAGSTNTMLFPDAASLSDSSELPTKQRTKFSSSLRRGNTSISHGLVPTLISIPLHPPLNINIPSTGISGGAADVMNGDRRTPLSSLESTQTIRKADTADTANAATRMVTSASPSQVAVSMTCISSNTPAARLTPTLGLKSNDRSLLSLRSGDITEDAVTVPYYSQTHRER